MMLQDHPDHLPSTRRFTEPPFIVFLATPQLGHRGRLASDHIVDEPPISKTRHLPLMLAHALIRPISLYSRRTTIAMAAACNTPGGLT